MKKRVKKVGWILFGVLASLLIIANIYILGKNTIELLPQWLTAFMVGFLTFFILVIIILIFTLGITKIKEFGKEASNE